MVTFTKVWLLLLLLDNVIHISWIPKDPINEIAGKCILKLISGKLPILCIRLKLSSILIPKTFKVGLLKI